MARQHTKNTANRLFIDGLGAIGNVLNGAEAITIVAQIRPDIFDTGTNSNRVVHWLLSDAISNIFSVSGVTTTTANLRHQGRGSELDGSNLVVGSGPGAQVSVDEWQLVGVVLNFLAGERRLYHNAVQLVNNTSIAFASPTYVQGSVTAVADSIGGPAGSNLLAQLFSGLIEYLGAWRTDILTAGFQALTSGTRPFALDPAPDILLILGYETPDVCVRGSGLTTSVMGSMPFVEGPTGMPITGPTIVDTTGTAAGSSLVTGVSAALAETHGAAGGEAAALAQSEALAATQATSAGQATVTGQSAVTASAVGHAAGAASAEGLGGAIATTVVASAGAATLAAPSAALVAATGTAEGWATVVGLGGIATPGPEALVLTDVAVETGGLTDVAVETGVLTDVALLQPTVTEVEMLP